MFVGIYLVRRVWFQIHSGSVFAFFVEFSFIDKVPIHKISHFTALVIVR